jgi:saccharopine dehydrogenase (NAD+, L-lysine-forming)
VRFLKNEVERLALGPSEEHRKTARMSIWGRVENAAGVAVDARLDVPEGYELTALAAVAAAERVLSGGVPPGATTPSRAFGADFVTTLPGVGPLELR